MSQLRVKGSHLIQARELVDERLGAGSYDELARREDVQASHGTLLPGAWYDAPSFVLLLRCAARELGVDVETLSAQIARRNAKTDLPSLYKVFLRIAQPQHLLHFVPQLWRTYCDFAAGHAVQNDVGRFVGQCDELPSELLPWACGAWLGFLPAAVELCGHRVTHAKIVRTWRQGAAGHSLQLELLYTRGAA